MSLVTRLFDNGEIIVYEQQEKSIWGLTISNYYWSLISQPVKLVGPFNSALAATQNYEAIKQGHQASPNVIHVNFVLKRRMTPIL